MLRKVIENLVAKIDNYVPISILILTLLITAIV